MKTSLRHAIVLMFVVALGILAGAQRQRPDTQAAAGRAVARGVTAALPPGQAFQGVTVAVAAEGPALREWDDRIAAGQRTRELRLRTSQADTLMPGRVHERLDQYYKGVPVFGGEALRESDRNLTMSVTATVYSGLNLDTTPTLSAADAVRVFVRETGADPRTNASPQLVVLPRPDGTYALTYRLAAVVRHALPVVFVNARSGAVEMQYDNLQTQQKAAALMGSGVLVSENLVASDLKKVSCALQGSTYLASDLMRPIAIRTYDLKGNVSRADSIIAGRTAFVASDLATSSGTTWADSVVVDGHTYIGWTYDYFYQRDGWKGFDGNNARTVSVIVHPAYRADMNRYVWANVSDYYANAFFCPQCGAGREDLIMFGEGLPAGYSMTSTGQYLDYFVAAPDIVAHEYAHGVTAYTSNLIYRNESGALSEAFSDAMGISMKFFQKQAGSGLLQADYTEGKETARPSRPGSAYGSRNLANPAAFGDPDHYSKRYLGSSDNGGVHTNSTIASHAFYLAIEGGKNATSGLSVTGVGAANRDKVEKAFFRGFTTLTANATFSMARAKTIQAARDLYGAGSAVETAITQAWNAVGVF
jgi:Zn-dependent metalloprotease